ncbi:MAG: patatin-like phospholipase family protein [Deltaproteobacteria bacterium]|nr:patatin-like phospholipase family protein [Deltaproteobacteria bacterium]
MTTVLCSTPASAQAAGENRAQRYVRPISVTAQLAYCRELVAREETSATLAKCFRYADFLLEEGVRQRRETPARSAAFEERLELGAKDIAARLGTLSLGNEVRLDQELRDLDQVIRSLRAELSYAAAADRMQLSLVSRGGASLGNWQAGFLYSVTEWAKGRPGQRAGPALSDPAFSTVTGASAGAVNGLAAAIEGCKGPNLSASESLYYQVWMNLGLFGRHGKPGLFPGPEGGSSTLSLFTDEALAAALEKTRNYVEQGRLLPSCSVDFGFVATHIDPMKSPVHVREDGEPILTTKKLKEKFSVRLTSAEASSDASASEPGGFRIVNIGPTGARKDDQIYYAGLGHAKEVPLQSLMLGVRASGAFPTAFPPVPLAYTQYVHGPGNTLLTRKRVATFIDGGILDNTPVGLAVALDEWRGAFDPPDPYLEGLVPVQPRTYLFLEPLVKSWVQGGASSQESGASAEDGLIGTYLTFTRDLLATTTDAQLTNTAEQFEFVRREKPNWGEPRLSVPQRHMPITGEQFEHFMAFLERDFRIFDFYVGMADAYAHLEREACFDAPEGASCQPGANLRQLDAALKEGNPNYRCIRAYYESDASQVLQRIGADQLPDQCQDLQPVVCAGPHEQDSAESVAAYLASGAISSAAGGDRCIEPSIANHNFRALLVSMHNYKVWLQSDQFSEGERLDRFFAELSEGVRAEQFIYVDLPTHLKRNVGYMNATEVKQAFRSLLQEGIIRLAEEQEGTDEYALKLAGRAAADGAYGKQYPKHIIGLGVAQNGFEAVYGRRLGSRPWRWDSTFRFFNLEQKSYARNLDPFTSEFYLSTQITRTLSPLTWADVEIGAGWALNEKIAYNSSSPGHVAFRTGPRSYLAFVILQRLYLALNVDYYPVNELDSAYDNLGVTVTEDWEFNLTGGWRFLF